jgi:hypothetical protein
MAATDASQLELTECSLHLVELIHGQRYKKVFSCQFSVKKHATLARGKLVQDERSSSLLEFLNRSLIYITYCAAGAKIKSIKF